MEILFRHNGLTYFIEDGILKHDIYSSDFEYIPQFRNIEVLYYYVNIISNEKYPVYFDYEDRFITTFKYIICMMSADNRHYIKDYTIPNLRLLEDGNII